MTEKIVVALNGAPVSARTVEWALERAIERRQRIELVGIVGGVVGSVGEVGILNDALESTQEMLDAHAERIERSIREQHPAHEPLRAALHAEPAAIAGLGEDADPLELPADEDGKLEVGVIHAVAGLGRSRGKDQLRLQRDTGPRSAVARDQRPFALQFEVADAGIGASAGKFVHQVAQGDLAFEVF